MPKFRVKVVIDRWEKDDIVDFHHGTVASSSGFSTKDIEIEAPNISSAVDEAKRVSGASEIIGEPVLITY